MKDEPGKDADPSPESILRAIDEDDEFGGTNSPTLEALRSVIERLGAAAIDDMTSPFGDDDGETCFGHFQIERELGRGGFGRVFLAVDRTLNRQVALKVPRPKLCASEKLRRAWLAEAESVALLDHPYIVPVFAAGEIDNLIYIVSAYCPGKTLDEWFDEQGRTILPRQAAHLMICLADAVAHAHDRGILHRDIKPSNILCQAEASASGDQGTIIPRLTDFGLAKSLRADADPAEDSGPIGTPRYMAPEQAAANGPEVGVATDVYSLGVVLFELLTGEPPFVNGEVRETLKRIQHEEVSPARLQELRVPRDLQAICLKCLAKRPADRYASAKALRDELQRFLDYLPVLARPVGPVMTIGRWCQRRPAVAGLLGTVLLAIILGTSTAAWYAREARRQTQQSQRHEIDAREQAARAEQHLADAQRALLDLGWIAQETTVWIDAPDHFQSAVRDQANRHYQQLIDAGIDSKDTSLRAAALSVQGLQASRADEDNRARQAFEASLTLWRDAIAQYPESRQYRRSLALTLFSYEQHLQRERRRMDPNSPDAGGQDSEAAIDLATVDPRVQEEYAVLLYELGCNHLLNSQKPAAREMFSRSLFAWDGLLQKDTSNTDYRLRKAQSERHLGELTSRLRRHREIPQGHLESSLANLEQVVSQAPTNQSYRYHLAQTCLALGHFHRKDESKKALSYFERSVEILELLDPKVDPGIDYTLADALAGAADLCQERGDFRKALKVRERCVEIWIRLHREQALDSVDVEKFASACHGYATLADLRKQTEVARVHYARAQELFEELDRQGKLSSLNRVDWANCMVFAGNELMRRGDAAAAEVQYRRAMDQLSRVVARQPRNELILQRQRELQARLEKLASVAGTSSESLALPDSVSE